MIHKIELDANGDIDHVYVINSDNDYVNPKRGIVITAALFETLMDEFSLLRTIYIYDAGKLKLRPEADIKKILETRKVEGLTEENVTDVLSKYKTEESENLIKDLYVENDTQYGSVEDEQTSKTNILEKTK